MKIILIYWIVINLVGLAFMGIDKQKAIRGAYRISERTLFLTSLFGGSVGTWAGMYLFRHKTKHWYFVIGMPTILFLQIGILIWLLAKGIL